jgi:sporulation protein YlmC with PRC-barrel domain
MKSKNLLMIGMIVLLIFVSSLVSASDTPSIIWELPTPEGGTTTNSWVYLNTTITDDNDTSAFFDWNNSLVGYWSMESYNSTGIYDNSSYNNFGTFGGGLSTSDLAPGKFGDSITVGNNYLNVGQDSSLDVGIGTWETWIYPTSFTDHSYHTIISKFYSTAYWFGLYTNTGRIQMWVGGVADQSASAVEIDQWSHVVVTWDGATIKYYINGDHLVGEDDVATGDPRTNDYDVHIGADPQSASYRFTGKIDEARIYNRVLSPEEIKASYNNSEYRLYHNFTSFTSPTNYTAWAIDSDGNINNSEGVVSFASLPTYSLNSTNSTLTGTNILHSLKWSDETELSGYIFSFDNGTGIFVNDSWVAFNSNPDWSNVTKSVTSTVGAIIRWCVYANDTTNGWGNSCAIPFSYVVNEAIPPTYSLNSTNSTLAGTNILHSLKWSDETELSGYIFSFCNGTWDGSNCLGNSSWANNSFDRCMEINISNAGSTDLINFPVYIDLSKDENMLSDYSDLRFYNSSCNNEGEELDYEIDIYTSAKADIWVRIPNLTSSGKTISVYYSNNTVIESGDNPEGVWDEGYKMVQHLEETSGVHNDSTSNNYDANETITSPGTQDATGKIGGADDFDTDDYIRNDSFSMGSDPLFTVSGWFKRTSSMVNTGAWGMGEGGNSGQTISGWSNVGQSIGIDLWEQATFYVDYEYPLNEWVYVTWIKNASTFSNSTIEIYVNGEKKTLRVSRGTIHTPSLSNGVTMGAIQPATMYNAPVVIDEFRVSNNVRTADWINQSYQMIENQNTYVEFGTEERIGWKDDSFVSMTGIENWSNVTKAVSSTVGTTYAWCVYANDTSNNWNDSCATPFSYTTTAMSSPTLTPTPDSPSGGSSCKYIWECDSWSSCSFDGQQERICKNTGTCIGTEGKPIEYRNCSESLFDVILKFMQIELAENQSLSFNVSLIQTKNTEKKDVQIKYTILDINKKEIFVQLETRAIEEDITYNKIFDEIKLSAGEYTLKVDITYGDLQKARAEQVFIVKENNQIEIAKKESQGFENIKNFFNKVSNFFSLIGKSIFQSKNYLFIGSGIFILVGGIMLLIKLLKRKSNAKISKEKNSTEYRNKIKETLRKIRGKSFLVIIFSFIFICFFAMAGPRLTGFAVENQEVDFNGWKTISFVLMIVIIGLLAYYNKEKIKILIRKKYPKNSISGFIGKKVYVANGNYLGKVDGAVLKDYKIEDLRIKLSRELKKKFNVQGIVLKFKEVRSVGHIVIVEEKIIKYLEVKDEK